MEDFNFYIVLEYINVFDSIDYDKIFPQKGIFIDYQSLQKEQNILNLKKKGFTTVFTLEEIKFKYMNVK